jgi:hypothetical protein
MSGLHGCLPQFCSSSPTVSEALTVLTELHGLSTRQRRELSRTGLVSLRQDQGAEYAQVELCTCSEPSLHDDF